MESVRAIVLGLAVALSHTAAGAETGSPRDVANPAPGRNPGCVPYTEAGPGLSPPDLAKGAEECVRKGDYDRAIDLVGLLVLRSRYDETRIGGAASADISNAIMTGLRAKLDSTQIRALAAAFERFGQPGSPRRRAFCQAMRVEGPPTYVPVYMTARGKGVLPRAPGFVPQTAWSKLLREFLECGTD